LLEEIAAVTGYQGFLEVDLVAHCGHRAEGFYLFRTWIVGRLERLDELLRGDVGRAKVELAKHLGGDLVLSPRPGPAAPSFPAA
jgi:hypothetical protein